MISNYIKLAFRVLGRKKFFTFISLFGISFTLMILMVMVSFLQAQLGSDGPLKYKDRIAHLPILQMQKQFYDTIQVYDTAYVEGVMQVDSTEKEERRGRRINISEMSRSLLEDHLPKVDQAENFTIYSEGSEFNVYVNNSKVTVSTSYTDHNYWSLFPHEFIEGRPYNELEWQNEARVIVISTNMAEKFFGRDNGVIGEKIELDEKQFEVIGVVEGKVTMLDHTSAEAYIPYTNQSIGSRENFYNGPFAAAVMAEKGVSLQRLKDELIDLPNIMPINDPDRYNEIILTPHDLSEIFAVNILYDEDPSYSYNVIFSIIGSLLLLFIILPTLNLINLNVSRIMDRSSEIGVRKAFGANKADILMQFIFENIILTVIGGIIGLGLALIIINMINTSQVSEMISLTINWKFFGYSMLLCLFFGVLSGLLPAYKMSNLKIVKAIKQTQL